MEEAFPTAYAVEAGMVSKIKTSEARTAIALLPGGVSSPGFSAFT